MVGARREASSCDAFLMKTSGVGESRTACFVEMKPISFKDRRKTKTDKSVLVYKKAHTQKE